MRNTRIRNIFNPTLRKGELGIEIEMEGALPIIQSRWPAKLAKNWDVMMDGSLRGESAEFVLKTPLDLKEAKLAVQDLYNGFSEHNCVLAPSKRCGVHVHVNVQELTEEDTLKFILLYLAFENILLNWCGSDRVGNFFCLRAEDASELVEVLSKARYDGKFTFRDHSIRYASVNIGALKKYGSVEFRGLGTTRSYNKILKWLRMLSVLKAKSLTFAYPEEIINRMSSHGVTEFIQSIFGRNSVLLRSAPYEDLEKMLRSGVRNVQHVLFGVNNPEKEFVDRSTVNLLRMFRDPYNGGIRDDMGTTEHIRDLRNRIRNLRRVRPMHRLDEPVISPGMIDPERVQRVMREWQTTGGIRITETGTSTTRTRSR